MSLWDLTSFLTCNFGAKFVDTASMYVMIWRKKLAYLNQFQNSYIQYVSREIHLCIDVASVMYIVLTLSSAFSAVVPMVSDHDLLPKDRGIWRFFTHLFFTRSFLKLRPVLIETQWRNDAFAFFWRVSVRVLDKNEESYFFIGLEMNKLVYKSYQN